MYNYLDLVPDTALIFCRYYFLKKISHDYL